MPRFDGLRDHLRAGRVDFASRAADEHFPPDLRLEPEKLELDLRVEVEARRAAGSVTHTVRGRDAGARTLELDAVAIDVRGVADPDGRPLRFAHDGERIVITWDEPFAVDERRRVRVDYEVRSPSTGLFFSQSPRWAATDHETERARHWLPCVDHPSVRPHLSLKLRADAEFTILANGLLQGEETHEDGTKTAHWVLDQPCPAYLTCFALGELVRHDDGAHEGVELSYFAAAPFTEAHLQRSFGQTGAIMKWLTRKLGRSFPYPKYYQFALPGIGGAMENISLVSWDEVFLLDETFATEWGELVDQINLHEMAHAYFGDMVVIRGFAHAWLKESWATYMEAVWFEETAGTERADYELWLQGQSYFREARERYRRPIVTHRFDSSWDLFDMHLYPGGARRLHALRCELGDGPFWAGVRDYLERHAHDVAETDDFRRCLERQSGRSLGHFFEQWFRTAGHPVLEVAFEHDAEAGLGTFTITQTQVDEKKGVRAFAFPLELAWTVGEERSSHEAHIERAKQVITLPMPTRPTRVRVNPRQRALVEFEPDFGDDLLIAQLTGAPDVVGRIEAGRALARRGRSRGLEALAAAWDEEAFWGVRAEWARALGKSGSQAAVELLAGRIEREQDPRVLEPFMRGATEVRDPSLKAAVLARLEAGLPYRAAATAWEALGRYGDEAPLEGLAGASQDRGLHGLVASGAARGLAHSRRPEARAALEAVLEPGAPSRSRQAAAQALGQLALRLERAERAAAVARLVDLLRDPDHTVRRSAVQGLGAARASEAAAALEAYRGPLPRQEQVAVDRTLAQVRKGAGPQLASVEKRLDEMHGVVRKLEARLDKLEARVEAAHPDQPRGPEQAEG